VKNSRSCKLTSAGMSCKILITAHSDDLVWACDVLRMQIDEGGVHVGDRKYIREMGATGFSCLVFCGWSLGVHAFSETSTTRVFESTTSYITAPEMLSRRMVGESSNNDKKRH
jgi:hypothetical protein